jgi:spore maturation protein SpmA
MVLNYIWVGFFLFAFITAVFRVAGYLFRDYLLPYGFEFTWKDVQVFSTLVESTFKAAETSIDLCIYLIGAMTLWLGIMKVGEDGGAINALARLIGPFFKRLFPEIPENHPAHGSILMNFSANMLGLDNAATPLGLKAMKELQELNPDKERASNSQIMFLVLNTAGLTIIPVSIMAIRAGAKSANPAEVFLPILLATFFGTLAALISVSIFQRINLFDKVVLGYLVGASLIVASLIWIFTSLPQTKIGGYSSFLGNSIIFSIIIVFILLAVRSKINIFESFIEGAKGGINVAFSIIPYLVAMLVAIAVFRASGGMDIISYLIAGFFKGINLILGAAGMPLMDLRFIDALPVVLMKSLSGSGARGLMVDTINAFGVDSFQGKLAATFQGSTETTFYVLAVYFGSVGIKHTRYAVTCGLLADLAGAVAAIVIAYIFFV